MTNTTATATHSSTVGSVEVAADVFEEAGRFIIHVRENGRHTGSVYVADSAAARDELIDIILGRA
ncbi:hypothetical protein [Microbacterium sp. B24]|uniref:hypothetical protein n=1 Tax=Microbacterium sp. B24 TaxID=95616 RepID=UPI0004284684|nr:hypothetical protein [Microbacterium sp. B24]